MRAEHTLELERTPIAAFFVVFGAAGLGQGTERNGDTAQGMERNGGTGQSTERNGGTGQ